MERDLVKVPNYHQLTPAQAELHRVAEHTAMERLCFAAFLAEYGYEQAELQNEPDHDALAEQGHD
jgi:hypothetical protein